MDNPKCNVIVFSNRAIDEIKKETYRKSPAETGGILLGKIIDDTWYVIATTEPGPNSIFQISYFEYDQDFVTKEANRISKEYEHELELLGLWHRHPGSMDVFSNTDNGTNTLFAKLRVEGAISGLVNLDPDFRLTMYHVDLPLKYEKIEIFADDELIPPDLLKLKPVKVVKNENIEPLPEEKPITGLFPKDILGEERENNKNDKTMKYNITKIYFLLMGLLSLLLLFFVLYQVGNGKTINDKPDYTLIDKSIDSLKVAYGNEYEKKYKADKEQIFKDEIDSLQKVDKDNYIKNLFVALNDEEKKDSIALKTKFAKEYDNIHSKADSLNRENIKLLHNFERQKFIETKLNERQVPDISWFKKISNSLKPKTPLLLLINLLVFTFLSFYKLKTKGAKSLLVIVLSLLVGFASFILLPVNTLIFGLPFIYKLSISLCIIWVVVIFVILLNKINLKKNSFWYEKPNSIIETEKSLVNSNYPKFKLDSSEEDGRLFWVGELVSKKGNSYHIQVVYDNDYNGDFNKIHTYFIDPELSELQVDKSDLPFTSLDSSNTVQLQFERKGKKNTALHTIRLTEMWIINFESWLDKKITIEDFKKLKIK